MKKIALLFPGTGTQYIGMGKELFRQFQTAKQVFEEASDVLKYDMKRLCFEGDSKQLMETMKAQTAIFTVGVAAFRVFLEQFGYQPTYMAGHSVGEYSALACAGVIRFQDAIKIVQLRGRYMQELVKDIESSMIAVNGLDREAVRAECERYSTKDSMAFVSNHNSPNQFVVSGNKKAVLAVASALNSKGAQVIPLNITAPAHCILMKPVADRFRSELLKLQFHDFTYPVISNVTAFPYVNVNKDTIVDMLTEQLIRPVQWHQTMRFLMAEKIDVCIDLGPKDTLKALSKLNSARMEAYSFDKLEDFEHIRSLNINLREEMTALQFIEKCLAIAVCTPNYNDSSVEYHNAFIEPIRKLKQMLMEPESNNENPSKEQMTNALELLRMILLSKKTPMDEVEEIVKRLIRETSAEVFGDSFTTW
ncbi:ACP S-malonyltransferase [Brevibacillus sp. SAFN-007a]|uniref:ACP S-malonyltransferase n=1 Tax=Brevibacillus sp. SAFN-007a TaxID=3436862 RepID=UPI003F80F4B5